MHRRQTLLAGFSGLRAVDGRACCCCLLLEGSGPAARLLPATRPPPTWPPAAGLFAEAAKPELEQGRYGERSTPWPSGYGKAGGLRITVVLPDGKVVAESDENPAVHGKPPHAARKSPRRWTAASHAMGRAPQRHAAKAIPLRGPARACTAASPSAVVRVSMPATAVDEVLRAFRAAGSLYGTLAAVAAVVALSWLIARRVSRPLEVDHPMGPNASAAANSTTACPWAAREKWPRWPKP